MKKDVELSNARRRTERVAEGKTRITIYLDDIVIQRFKVLARHSGKGYQTLLNAALRLHLSIDEAPLTAPALRRILREELSHAHRPERLQ